MKKTNPAHASGSHADHDHGHGHDDKPQDFLHVKHGHDGGIIYWSLPVDDGPTAFAAALDAQDAPPEPSWVSDPAVGPTMMDFLVWASYHPVETATIPDEFLAMVAPDGLKAMADWTEEHNAYVAYNAGLEQVPADPAPELPPGDDSNVGDGGDLSGDALAGWFVPVGLVGVIPGGFAT